MLWVNDQPPPTHTHMRRLQIKPMQHLAMVLPVKCFALHVSYWTNQPHWQQTVHCWSQKWGLQLRSYADIAASKRQLEHVFQGIKPCPQ